MNPTNTTSVQTNTQLGDMEYAEILNNLVISMTGKSLLEHPAEKVEQVAKDCLKTLTDYIENYIKQKYGARSSMQFKIIQANKNGDRQWADVDQYTQEAWKDFFEKRVEYLNKALNEQGSKDENKALEV
jgi:arginine utilization protein RocB